VEPSVPATSAVVSAATSVAADSWVTVYDTNLDVTKRAWSDVDFTNGGLPFSLDGVSVVLTVCGAPRLAYVGYVSPTQVNFLLPSDSLPGNVQVRVRNPAGMSAPAPMSIQANALQLLTVDGKLVAGAHANGDSLDRAAPGESVVLYGTGCGPANPALIPGQIPTEAASLVRPPQVSIGGATATASVGSARNAARERGRLPDQRGGSARRGDGRAAGNGSGCGVHIGLDSTFRSEVRGRRAPRIRYVINAHTAGA